MREQAIERLEQAAAIGNGGGGGGAGPSLVQKWAPGDFSGEHGLWRDWSIKFRSYMGSLLRGEVGRWLEHIDECRATSAKVAVLAKRAEQHQP